MRCNLVVIWQFGFLLGSWALLALLSLSLLCFMYVGFLVCLRIFPGLRQIVTHSRAMLSNCAKTFFSTLRAITQRHTRAIDRTAIALLSLAAGAYVGYQFRQAQYDKELREQRYLYRNVYVARRDAPDSYFMVTARDSFEMKFC